MWLLPGHTSLLSNETALSLSLSTRYKVSFQGCACVWLWVMKYSSHKKWLSSLSSSTHYNGRFVWAQTRGIVTHHHIRSPKHTLGLKDPLRRTSPAGSLAFFSNCDILKGDGRAAKLTHEMEGIKRNDKVWELTNFYGNVLFCKKF